MEDEHLDTISKTESDELIKSSVENLVPISSVSEDFSDIESDCDVPDYDDSQTTNLSMFSNPLFNDSTSSDHESSHEEVIHEIDLDFTLKNDRFDTESYLLESLLNRDTLMHEEYISLIERLLYDNSSPRSPEDFHANPNTIIESLPTFPIPVEDSNSLREEIDIFPGPDDSIPPPGDSLGSDLVVSFPSETRNKIFDPRIFIGVQSKIFLSRDAFPISFMRDPLSPVFNTLLLFSSVNEDKVFNPGILASNEETSPHLLSHRGFNPSKIIFDFSESLMMIFGRDIPILDVPFFHFYPP
ncbi:hypothetical protein Tco_0268897 [Tanacetum coccineum]